MSLSLNIEITLFWAKVGTGTGKIPGTLTVKDPLALTPLKKLLF
jgi:hypothetical protein